MAEGGSSPLGDTGGLHLYNMNGGTHKLAELVADVSGPIDIMCSPTSTSGGQMSYSGSPEPSPYGNSMHGASFNYPETVGYDTAGYDDIKRSTNLQSAYYTPMEPTYQNSHGSMFDNQLQGYSPGPDMYKASSDGITYTDMMPSTDTMNPSMVIKKEKLDYNEQLGLIGSPTSDIPYPPNTCIADWNYFNSMNTHSTASSVDQQPHFSSYPQTLPAEPPPPPLQFHGGQFFNTAQEVPMPIGLSNVDIHNQSKKITQSILSAEWSNETLYKSQLYANLSAESVNKKRCAGGDRRVRPPKSRRKQATNIGGHSKAVASILLSENNISGQNFEKNSAKHQNLNEDVLDSSERNSLVTSLMNNLRSTVQFESFCLSFPRSRIKENAFHRRVIATASTISDLENKAILSKPIPRCYVQGAEMVLNTFTKALNKMSKDTKNCGKQIDDINLSCDQVEEHLPHSMVWVMKVGDKMLSASWEGQFVVTVNPVQNTLCCSIFQFSPKFSPESVRCLQDCRLSADLAQDIIENMEQFEVSRQLRFDINLKNVVKMYLYMEQDNATDGCLVLEVLESPHYFQRWLHTSAENKNKWRERSNFFTKCSEYKMSEFVYIGGLSSELNELVALMLASSLELKTVFEIGITNPFHFVSKVTSTNDLLSDENGQTGNKLAPKKAINNGSVKTAIPLYMQGEHRNQVKKVLAEHGLDIWGGTEEATDDGACNTGLDIRLDLGLSSCFRDYIIYKCESASELNRILHTKVSPGLYGFYDNDFNMSLVPDRDLERLTVGQLISTKCSEIVYYSFCRKDVGQLGHDFHCSQCGKCLTYRYWHCQSCDRCSESGNVCEFCGHLRDDQTRVIIKPLSVFKSELKTGTINLGYMKDKWVSALNLSDEDVLSLEPTHVDLTMEDSFSVMEYNSSNAMVDQLGLLNPVGFLLGQGAAGACRKHRRNKGTQLTHGSLEGASKGGHSSSGCILQ